MVIIVNVLITGAASGIGFALGKKLIEKGHFVYFCVHNNKEIKTVKEKLNNLDYKKTKVIKLDITRKEDIDLIKNIDIDCLVNQAGIGVGGSIINLSIENIRKNFDVNYFGTLSLIKTYIKTRINKKGKILITSSVAGLIPIPFLGAYCSTKSSLIMMSKCLKKELKETNLDIKIKLIEPGAYKTGFNQIMIDNKEILNNEVFNDMKKIISKQEKMFNFIEKKDLSSIVKAMVKAVESDSNKLIYRKPFIQALGAKIYMLLFM